MKTLLKVLLLLLGALAIAALLVTGLRTGAPPAVELLTQARAIGPQTSVVARARVVGGRGLAGLRLEVAQKGRTHVVAVREHQPLPAWSFWGERTLEDELTADVGHRALVDLEEGEVVLRAIALQAGTWLRSPAPIVRELRLPVRRTPPSLSLLSTQHYVMQGGAGLVAYRVSATSASDYVLAGDWRFPGIAAPGSSAGERVALFGVPWDLDDPAKLRIVAEDDAGNAVSLAFVDRFERRPPARDRILLDDAFLAKVTTEIGERTPGLASRGNLLDDYLVINRDLRAANARELVELARGSAPAFLWSDSFAPLRNAKVMSAFADRRSYLYQGREVDQQTHLGFDLAAVAHTEVPAPARGVVRLARYFGIYGNAVVLDHGLGLASLAAHLSSIEVKEGQEVDRGTLLGRTGATGLAGGDHLHFTTLVGGLPVNPIEWWDAKWVRERIASKLPHPPAPAVPAR